MTAASTSPRPRATSYTDKAVAGSRTQLAGYLADLTERGALVSMTAPQAQGNGRFRVEVRVRTNSTALATPGRLSRRATARRRRITRRRVLIVVVPSAVVGLVAAGWLLVDALIRWVSHTLTGHGALLVGLFVVAALLLAATGRAVVHHCPGCRH